jgi:hypothetical protein
MAGKAPLLLATVLFVVGAVGLLLTSAERASWGPFKAPQQPGQKVVVVDLAQPFAGPPALTELLTSVEPSLEAESPQALVQAPLATPEPQSPTPTPIPPLRIFGISADDGGVAAAAATPSPPPPIRVVGIAVDSEPPAETQEAETPVADDGGPAGEGGEP